MVSEDVQRDSEVWCSDGNLLIVAEHTCFRVHRSMISRHSNTFLNLVQPQGVVQEDVPEGCSVVRASDSAHDLKHLLRILYDGYEDGPHSYLKQIRPIHFADLAAAARLAHKYSISFVLEETAIRLRSLFPKDFDVWEKNEEQRSSGTLLRSHDAIEAVNLFRAVSEWIDMLPSALYLCAQLSPHDILKGHKRADGTVERLAIHDIALCWTLQKAFAKESALIALSILKSGASTTCRNTDSIPIPISILLFPGRCRTCSNNILERTACSAASDAGIGVESCKGAWNGDPLGTHLRSQIDQLCDTKRICDECETMLRAREQDRRREFWMKMPELIRNVEVD